MNDSFYSAEGVWLKGNLHSHSTVSDGYCCPEKLAGIYAEKGYDFLSMTDHNVYVEHKELCSEKLIVLTGIEHDIEYSPNKCTHVVGIGAYGKSKTDYDCRRYSKSELSDQQMVDMMKADGQFVTLAHPVWSRMEAGEVLSLENLDAVEVFNNGTEHLCHAGRAELYWDLLLQQGKKLYATASDDVHTPDDLFGGWIWVKAAEKTPQNILEALRRGHFYASCGPEIHDFHVKDGRAHVSCSPCSEIHFITYEPRGKSVFAGDTETVSEAEFKLSGGEKYVRAVCVDARGRSAWAQPVYP